MTPSSQTDVGYLELGLQELNAYVKAAFLRPGQAVIIAHYSARMQGNLQPRRPFANSMCER